MQLVEQQQKAQELMNSIIMKCWEDENFKQELISSPETTLEKFIGKPINLPEGKNLVVVDQSRDSNKTYLNIPSAPDFDNLQLTDEQLETIAGGGSPFIASSTPCAHGAAWALGVIISLAV